MNSRNDYSNTLQGVAAPIHHRPAQNLHAISFPDGYCTKSFCCYNVLHLLSVRLLLFDFSLAISLFWRVPCCHLVLGAARHLFFKYPNFASTCNLVWPILSAYKAWGSGLGSWHGGTELDRQDTGG
jgi:hypothetical protein